MLRISTNSHEVNAIRTNPSQNNGGTLSNLRQWRKDKGWSQEQLAKKLGLGDKWRNYPNWESGRSPFPKEIKDKLNKLGYIGSFESEEGMRVAEEVPYLRDYNPGEYAAAAYLIVKEAARAGGAPLDSLDDKVISEVIGLIADAVAQGRGEEAQQRLVQRAEVLLRAMGRGK